MSLSRRRFCQAGLTTLTAAGLASPFLSGCATLPRQAPRIQIDDLLSQGARVMWVAAHPDDESLVGSIMAKSSLTYHNPLYFLLLTHGEGGECCRPEGCEPDLATVRAAEMQQVADLYRAELQMERYFNASLPVESFPKRHEIARLWQEKQPPDALIATAIRRFKPDVLFTFDPHHGFTGHPEHQLTSRFSTAGVRLAADASLDLDGLPAHRVSHVYFGLNKYWIFKLALAGDPGPVTEVWPADQHCINGWECRRIMARFSKAHRSQDRDMGNVRRFIWLFDSVYLRRTNPFTEILDPFEEV